MRTGTVVPSARRTAVSRQAGWISPVVVARGVVCGTWTLDGDRARDTAALAALEVEYARAAAALKDLRDG